MEEPLQTKKPLGFWKTVLASFVGFIAANVLCSIFAFFLFIVIVVGALASGSTPTEIRDGSVLKIDLSSISEIVTTLGLLQPTVSMSVAALEEEGLVERTEAISPAGTHVTNVTLTDGGQDAARRLVSQIAKTIVRRRPRS